MQTTCCVCSVETTKYRCPRCQVRYCSLSCCKKHKEGCIPKEAPHFTNVPAIRGVQLLETKVDLFAEDDESDKIPLQKLKLLEESEDLKHLLVNAHLGRMLIALDQAEKKVEALKEYMQEPLFVEFADKCLLVVDTEDKVNIYPG